MVTNVWNNTVKDIPLKQMMVEVLTRVYQDDPTQGNQYVTTEEVNIWVDTSSLAMGVINCATLENTCWLCPTGNVQHIKYG